MAVGNFSRLSNKQDPSQVSRDLFQPTNDGVRSMIDWINHSFLRYSYASNAAFASMPNDEDAAKPLLPSTDIIISNTFKAFKFSTKDLNPRSSAPRVRVEEAQHPLSASVSRSTARTASFSHFEFRRQNHMFYTPLPDYKHSANQTIATRAAAAAAKKVQRKYITSSGNTFERRHGVQTGETRASVNSTVPLHTIGPHRSTSLSTSDSSGLTKVTSSAERAVTEEAFAKPFTTRHGRRYLRDATLPYPLPCDLTELHRQTLRTMFFCQVFNGPLCSPEFQTKPPKYVLEVGCGTGFWSVMCHRHFSRRGHGSISFTGIDIAPLASRSESTTHDDMNWKFVQHDLRQVPLPFRDKEFNLVMIKDLSMVTPITEMQQNLMDEYLRILKPGGVLEIWDGDHSLRMLLPHAPLAGNMNDNEANEDLKYTNLMGIYKLTPHTPFAAPQNFLLTEYNAWIAKALERRKLSPVPCTAMMPTLIQESEVLTEIDSRRLAIPLGEVRWEREGVGGAVTQGSNGYTSKGKAKECDRKTLTASQSALRRTALMTVVQMIESLEPILREVSGKGHDEWDRWMGNVMSNLLLGNGTSWGECLEIGAWWGKKKASV